MSEPTWPDVTTYDRATQIGRSNWQVLLSVADVREAASKAAVHHREREEWWKAEAQTTKDKIGVEGLEVRENQVTGGVRHDVVIDPPLAARLNECEQKASKHRGQAEALERYDSFMAAGEADRMLTLTASDAEFFELGKH